MVNKNLQEHLKQAEVAQEKPAAAAPAAEFLPPAAPQPPKEAPAKTIAQMAIPAIQFLVEGDILLLPLGLAPIEKKVKVRSKLNTLKQAVAEMRGTALTLFPAEKA